MCEHIFSILQGKKPDSDGVVRHTGTMSSLEWIAALGVTSTLYVQVCTADKNHHSIKDGLGYRSDEFEEMRQTNKVLPPKHIGPCQEVITN